MSDLSSTPAPHSRFTGIFLPAEILSIPDISYLEMILLSWIDALHSDEHGGCYASNDYLASKLRIKKNTVSKAIVKLKRLKLLEDITDTVDQDPSLGKSVHHGQICPPPKERILVSRMHDYIAKRRKMRKLDGRWTEIHPPMDKNPSGDGYLSIPIYKEESKEKEKKKSLARAGACGEERESADASSTSDDGDVNFSFSSSKKETSDNSDVNPSESKQSISAKKEPKIKFDFKEFKFNNLTQEFIGSLKSTFKSLDIDRELGYVVNWIKLNKVKKAPRHGWERFINAWMINSDRGGGKHRNSKFQKQSPLKKAATNVPGGKYF